MARGEKGYIKAKSNNGEVEVRKDYIVFWSEEKRLIWTSIGKKFAVEKSVISELRKMT